MTANPPLIELNIRKAAASDLRAVYSVQRAAFGHDEEADLVVELLKDPSAKPLVSLLAFENGKTVGHILFTRARLENERNLPIMALLAPLAVVPAMQKRGIGGKLVEHGLNVLRRSGCDLVFVLGHTEYYPRHGFTPAGRLGFEAPYAIPEIHADAWMVHELRPGAIGSVKGKVLCADALNKPAYWRE